MKVEDIIIIEDGVEIGTLSQIYEIIKVINGRVYCMNKGEGQKLKTFKLTDIKESI